MFKQTNKLNRSLALIALLAVSAFTAPSAQAAMVTFDLAWSGANFGNSAVAIGQITLDDTLNTAGVNFVTIPDPSISSLSVTVLGASAGNGTFTTLDFAQIYFELSQSLNFSTDLVGQLGFIGFTVFDAVGGAAAPDGVGPSSIAANSGVGNPMELISMNPHVNNVPEPASFGLLGLGMAGLLLSRRKHKA
jgi:hypothetical protein